MHLVGFIIRIYHDARSPERQIIYHDIRSPERQIIYHDARSPERQIIYHDARSPERQITYEGTICDGGEEFPVIDSVYPSCSSTQRSDKK